MSRPIIPIAVRRPDRGRELEVQAKGGQWIPWNLLSPASKTNTFDTFRSHRDANDQHWPEGSFLWSADRPPVETSPDQQPQTQYQQEADDDVQDDTTREQDTQDTDQPVQEDQQVQQDTQQEDAPMTIEDMVRRIASELDEHVKADMLEQFEIFKPNIPTDNVVHVTTRVEVKTPTQHTTHDGLFHEHFGDLLHLVSIGQHVFLPGPPGSGKSHAAQQVAEVLGWKFGEISMSPDLPESRIWGGRTPDGFVETPLLEGLRFAQDNPDSGFAFLFDEMDAARASLVVSINSAAANCRVTAPNGDRLAWQDNVVFIGAANTFGTGPTAEFAGRNKLDAATLDRFAYIPWDTDPMMERQVVMSFLQHDSVLAEAWLDAWRTLRDNVKTYGLKTFVTMRGARNGARMLASGLDIDKTMMLVIGNKLPADQWAKVSPL